MDLVFADVYRNDGSLFVNFAAEFVDIGADNGDFVTECLDGGKSENYEN